MEELSEKFSISMDSVINSSNENKIIEENEQIEGKFLNKFILLFM